MNKWTVTHQDTTTDPITFGTISARDEESDWSAWIDNNPPAVYKKSRCAFNEHQWADTGMAKTWCKKCDLGGRWVMGNVEIVDEKEKET